MPDRILTPAENAALAAIKGLVPFDPIHKAAYAATARELAKRGFFDEAADLSDADMKELALIFARILAATAKEAARRQFY
jgi:hypothetical protein